MIDLRQLEEQLDNALNNETKESLTNWLLNRRKQFDINKLIDSPYRDLLIKKEISKVSYIENNVVVDNTSYALAA